MQQTFALTDWSSLIWLVRASLSCLWLSLSILISISQLLFDVVAYCFLIKKTISHNISLSSKVLQYKYEIYSFPTKLAT
jgi:hypothetical protein